MVIVDSVLSDQLYSSKYDLIEYFSIRFQCWIWLAAFDENQFHGKYGIE